MAISRKIEMNGGSLEALLPLEDEAFLKNVVVFPYLLEERQIRERVRKISCHWKKKVETEKSLDKAWEYILYLIHLYPRLLDLPDFEWLKEKFHGILMMRLSSSEHDRRYWDALARVRRAFTPTKPRTPEKKLMIARKFEYYRNQWITKKISETCKELLDIYNYLERDGDVVKSRFLKKIKTPKDVMERELGRLSQIYDKEIKGEGDFLMLPIFLHNDLMMAKNDKEIKDGLNFWNKIWKPILREVNQLKSTFIRKVANETGKSKESVRKLLKEAYKEME